VTVGTILGGEEMDGRAVTVGTSEAVTVGASEMVGSAVMVG